MVDRRYLEAPGNVSLEDTRDELVLKDWAKQSQREGSAMFVQLSHPGRQCPISVSRNTVAPSSVKAGIR